MRNATNVTVSTFGVVMGVAGIEHGIGEVLQGSRVPSGIVFPSWPDSPFFRLVAGEPAMSIFPNLLVTGILAILFSLIYIVLAVAFVRRKGTGLAMAVVSICMLLFGGGLFPPVLAFLISLLGTRIDSPLTWWRGHLPAGQQQLLGKVWPWSYGTCLTAWLLLFPGINILGYFFGVDNANLTVLLILLALGSLLITAFAGFGYDSQKQAADS